MRSPVLADEVQVVRDHTSLRRLAAILPDGPTTVISRHLLRRGLCTAYIVGRLDRFDALAINGGAVGEPTCHGSNVDAIWLALRQVPGWFAANVDEVIASDLACRLRDEDGVVTRTLGDLYFVLQDPVVNWNHPYVRLLAAEDVVLIDRAPDELHGAGFASSGEMVREGFVAGAIIDGQIVAIAHTGAITDGFADIGVATAEGFRNQGLSTVCASLVARGIQASGCTPVWSCGETNVASMRVAEKLGFESVARRVYVIRDDRPL